MTTALFKYCCNGCVGHDSATVNVLKRKLGFLLDGRENVGSEVMCTQMDDVKSVVHTS